MDTNTYTYRVLYNLRSSARLSLNLIPKPGTLTLSDTGTLALTDTTSQQVIVQKPLGELAGIRPLGFRSFNKHAISTGRAMMYVTRNEAYVLTFASDNPALTGQLDIYQELLEGDRAGAINEFKANSVVQGNRDEVNTAMDQANTDYANFITKAKQAGVYKSNFSSAAFIAGALIIMVVLALLLYGFLIAK